MRFGLPKGVRPFQSLILIWFAACDCLCLVSVGIFRASVLVKCLVLVVMPVVLASRVGRFFLSTFRGMGTSSYGGIIYANISWAFPWPLLLCQ